MLTVGNVKKNTRQNKDTENDWKCLDGQTRAVPAGNLNSTFSIWFALTLLRQHQLLKAGIRDRGVSDYSSIKFKAIGQRMEYVKTRYITDLSEVCITKGKKYYILIYIALYKFTKVCPCTNDISW